MQDSVLEIEDKRHKYLVACVGSLMILYGLAVLEFVATTPDIRLRVLLAEPMPELAVQSVGGPPAGDNRLGIVIERMPGLECKGVSPQVGDVLLKIGETDINSFLDFTDALSLLRNATTPPGGQLADPDADPSVLAELDLLPSLVEIDGRHLVKIEFQRPGWKEPETNTFIKVQSLPLGEVVLSFVWFLLQLGIFLVSGLSVWHRPFDRPARLFFVMCLVTLGAFVGGYHWWVISSSVWLNVPFIICAVLVPAVSLHFFLAYPRPKPPITNNGTLVLSGLYAVPVTAILGMIGLLASANWLNSDAAGIGSIRQVTELLLLLRHGIYAYLFFAAICFVLMLVALAYGLRATRNPIERSQMRSMLLAGIIAVFPVGYSLWLAMYDRVEFALGRTRLCMFLASLSFMVAYAVGMVRYRLMLADQIVSKGMLYYVASMGLTVLYGVTIAAASVIANHLNTSLTPQQALQQTLSVAAILILIVVILLWLRDRFQQVIDRRFYREKYQLDKVLQRMHRAVGHVVERQSLAQMMLISCRDALHAESTALYFSDAKPGTFQLIAAEGTDDLPMRLSPDESLLEAAKQDSMLQRANSSGDSSGTQAFLRTLRAELLYALESDEEIAGLVVLGPKRNGVSYSAEDLTFMNALGQITSVALYSAKVHQDMTRLNEELQLKAEKIGEQQRRIAILQSELTGAQSMPALERSDEFRRELIKGNSPAIRRVLETVRKVASSESSVLITGASGTGKELLAMALHENSPRRNGPMIRVHCAALSDSLLESELFGHVKGAFTGAHRDRIGRFEMANGGTLFLDEIGDISLETQIKLLRVLQTRSFEPVGGTRTLKVDVRLITATNQDLKQLIAGQRFRDDLFYRLNVISITLPSLKERKEDIFELSLHFLQKTSKRLGKRISHIDDEAVEALRRYDWPGNIRELENVIERAVVLADNETIGEVDLPNEITAPDTEHRPPRDSRRMVLTAQGAAQVKQSFDTDSERDVLTNALADASGNKAQAARLLRMPRSTYYSKLKKFGID